jgi:hypothetical protein
LSSLILLFLATLLEETQNSKCKIKNYNSKFVNCESMKQAKKIDQVLGDAGKLEKSIKELIRETEDYDLQRLLKKIDAELMDVRHNLVSAKKLAERTAL